MYTHGERRVLARGADDPSSLPVDPVRLTSPSFARRRHWLDGRDGRTAILLLLPLQATVVLLHNIAQLEQNYYATTTVTVHPVLSNPRSSCGPSTDFKWHARV